MTAEELLHKLTLAVEYYSAAGDESNSQKQSREWHDKARAIVQNEVRPGIENFAKTIRQQVAEEDRFDPVCSRCGEALTSYELVCDECREIGRKGD